MKRLLMAVAVLLSSCDDSIPGLCKVDSDCPMNFCYQGVCAIPELEQDAGAPDAAGSDASFLPDASMTDAGRDAGLPAPKWTSTTSPEVFRDVWGFAANDVWVVGEYGHVFHWDGREWSTSYSSKSSERFYAVWGVSSKDLWVAGYDSVALTGLAMHWDGEKWSSVPVDTGNRIDGLSGVSATDVWAVSGPIGTIHHWDGKTWSRAYESNRGPIHGISCLSPTSAWAAGENGSVYRWNGNAWSQIMAGGDNYAVSARSDSDVWVAATHGIHHFNGAAWETAWDYSEPTDIDTSIFGVFELAVNDIWAVGGNGSVLESSGTTFRPATSEFTATLYRAWGMSGVNSFVWMVGNGIVLSDLKNRTPPGFVSPSSVSGIAVGSSQDALSIGKRASWVDPFSVLRWNGSAWVLIGSKAISNMVAISHGQGATYWAADEGGQVYSFDGASWKQQYSVDAYLNDIGSNSAGEVWIAGTKGTVAILKNSTWKTIPTGAEAAVRRISGASAGDLWAVAGDPSGGSNSTILRFDGRSWSTKLTTPIYLDAIWDGGPGSVWAAGSGGRILRYDESLDSWLGKESGTDTALKDIWGSSSDDVWFAGAKGTILHWDGRKIEPVASGTGANLVRLSGSASDNVWAVGDRGTILHYSRQ